jgi:hypothetical protein
MRMGKLHESEHPHLLVQALVEVVAICVLQFADVVGV